MDTDILIVGAGPGGLQLGQTLAQLGHSFVIVERGAGAGSFFRQFPRHRTLISVNKLHTGYDDNERRMRFDWNSLLGRPGKDLFSEHSKEYFPDADAMVEYLEQFAAKHISDIRYNTEVASISARSNGFDIRTNQEESIRARIVVVATGVSQPYQPDIPGLKLAELYANFDKNPDGFEGKKVLIIGKGNSAFETADAIMHKAQFIHLVSPNSIKMAWNTHFPGHLRAVNSNFLDTYQLKIQNAVLDAEVVSLCKTESGQIRVSLAYTHAEGETEQIEYDRVICCTGFQVDHGMFADNCTPKTVHNGRFPALTPQFESSNVPGLFYAGTLTQSLDYKRSNSAFVHGFRYNSRALGFLLSKKIHGTNLPSETKTMRVAELGEKILGRLNRSSAQWQQFGFMGDIALVNHGKVTYLEDLPVQFAHRSELADSALYLVITLEFGKPQKNVFSIKRKPSVGAASQSAFLHPVVRLYSRGGKLRKRLDLLENLFGEWTEPERHLRPLLEFLRANVQRALNSSMPRRLSSSTSEAKL